MTRLPARVAALGALAVVLTGCASGSGAPDPAERTSSVQLEPVEQSALEETPSALVVIGSGGAAMAAGIEARARGKQVLLVEHGALGATRLNVVCVPSRNLRSPGAPDDVGEPFVGEIALPPVVYQRVGAPHRSPFDGSTIVRVAPSSI